MEYLCYVLEGTNNKRDQPFILTYFVCEPYATQLCSNKRSENENKNKNHLEMQCQRWMMIMMIPMDVGFVLNWRLFYRSCRFKQHYPTSPCRNVLAVCSFSLEIEKYVCS